MFFPISMPLDHPALRQSTMIDWIQKCSLWNYPQGAFLMKHRLLIMCHAHQFCAIVAFFNSDASPSLIVVCIQEVHGMKQFVDIYKGKKNQ